MCVFSYDFGYLLLLCLPQRPILEIRLLRDKGSSESVLSSTWDVEFRMSIVPSQARVFEYLVAKWLAPFTKAVEPLENGASLRGRGGESL